VLRTGKAYCLNLTHSNYNFLDKDSSAKKRVRNAVEHERTRLMENRPADEPATERGKQIARHMGTSAVVADYYVELAAKRILESDNGEDGKPN
jgi:hypothetical protein